MNQKHQILYIKSGPVLPPLDLREDEFVVLSDKIEGDVLIPVWGDIFFCTPVRGSFKYHLLKTWGLPPVFKQTVEILFFLFTGLKIYYLERRKYCAIVIYGTNTTGIGGLLLKFTTGAKLITEIPGNPSTAFIFDIAKPGKILRLKHRIANLLLLTCVKNSVVTKLLYPAQLDAYPILKNCKRTIFHALTPISHLSPSDVDHKYLFFLGYPWYLKGVDVLIKAFNLIKSDFPSHKLIIAGHCDDRSPFELLAGGDERIVFLKGLPHSEALDYMSKCSAFVLPSRTESMGKVLLEAMGFAKPVIGSKVDGIPEIVKDGENGYLFQSGNEIDLANKMRAILGSPELAKQLGKNGREFATTKVSEEVYIEKFTEMIKSALEK